MDLYCPNKRVKYVSFRKDGTPLKTEGLYATHFNGFSLANPSRCKLKSYVLTAKFQKSGYDNNDLNGL
jgi:hypothetical protein